MIFAPDKSTVSFTPTAGGGAVTFANLKDITLPSPAIDDLDGTTRTTLADSPSLARVFQPGLMDNGEFAFDSEPQELADITKITANVRKAGDWSVNYNGVALLTFSGYIKAFDFPDAMEEQTVIGVTVKVSGEVTVAAAPSA